MSIWKSRKATLFQKLMYTIGWVPRDITRELSCAWCGKHQTWVGDALQGPPSFCSTAHKQAAHEARKRRSAEHEIAERNRRARVARAELEATLAAQEPQKRSERRAKAEREAASPQRDPVPAEICTCTNHMGTPKQRYETNGGAALQLVRRHLAHGTHRIYQCPTSHYWHITSRPERNNAAA